jgi:hypothetical protein
MYFIGSSPPGWNQQHSLARWGVHPIVVARNENSTAEANYFVSETLRILFLWEQNVMTIQGIRYCHDK